MPRGLPLFRNVALCSVPVIFVSLVSCSSPPTQPEVGPLATDGEYLATLCGEPGLEVRNAQQSARTARDSSALRVREPGAGERAGRR